MNLKIIQNAVCHTQITSSRLYSKDRLNVHFVMLPNAITEWKSREGRENAGKGMIVHSGD